MYALVDCNNFYASCERVFRPDLQEKPIVILSNNDGCVIARSNEAKELGIPMGAPAFEYKQLFTKHGVSVFSSNFPLYGDMSQRVMSILETFSPEMEVYSIDEAFLQFSGFTLVDMARYGNEMRKRVMQWTGIPISIGFAPTKTLAKVANRVAKKYPRRTGGVYLLNTEAKRLKAMKWLAVEDVWGIGRRHAVRLHQQGVQTAYDFTLMNRQWVKKHMSVVGVRLQHELLGEPMLELETVQPRKSIATTRSFDHHCEDFEELRERITTFAVACAAKLRKQQSCCHSLVLFVATNGHRSDLPQYSRQVVLKLPAATNSSLELVRSAHLALQKIYKKGYQYKKAGVIVQDLVPEHNRQLSLFDNKDSKHEPLMQALDKLNQSYGQHKVRVGSQNTGRIWRMKQGNLSPSYTTKLSDIITVRC